MSNEKPAPDWRVDRKLSLTLVGAMVVHIGAAVWFASKVDSRVGALERQMIALNEQTSQNRAFQIEQRVRVWDRVTSQGEALNEFRAEIAGISARLDYITRALDRLTLLRDQEARSPAKPAR